MNPQQIAANGQKVVTLNGINVTLQTILVELNMTFQQIVADLQSMHAVQQELAKLLAAYRSQQKFDERWR